VSGCVECERGVYFLVGIITVALLVYLIATLLRPEWL
jgi:K+-transporting ATPase KdpF subunit